MKFENQTFTDTVVTLDYNEFLNCTFTRCRIVFHGGGFAIAAPKLNASQFVLADSASNTLALLKMLNDIDPQMTRSLIDSAGKATAPPPGAAPR
jgi:hypothetical protein